MQTTSKRVDVSIVTKTFEGPKNEDDLKNVDDRKNEDDLKNEDNLKKRRPQNENDL